MGVKSNKKPSKLVSEFKNSENNINAMEKKLHCIEQELPFESGYSTLDAELSPENLNVEIDVSHDLDDIPSDSFIVPAELTYHGFIYTQVCRGKRSCVYQQTLEEKTIAFEVFLIRIQHEAILGGKMIPAHERFPKDEDFGKTAWTYFTLEQAMEKFNELENRFHFDKTSEALLGILVTLTPK